MEGIDIQELARQLAVRMDPEAVWDTEDVGAYLKCSPRYVLEEYAVLADFPKATRIVLRNGKKGHPKWARQDIIDWWKKQREGRPARGGRPRQS